MTNKKENNSEKMVDITICSMEFSVDKERVIVSNSKEYNSKDRNYEMIIPVYDGNKRPEKTTKKQQGKMMEK